MGRTTASLFYALKDLDTPATVSTDKCVVAAGSSVQKWSGALTQSQCAELKPDTFLGQGAFASAYTQAGEPNRVVKFTADKLDAETCQKLVGKNLKRAVRVFDVAKLKGHTATALVMKPGRFVFESKPKQPIFSIVTEKLGKLSKVQRAATDAFHDILKDDWAGEPLRNKVLKADPATYKAQKLIKPADAVKHCVRYTHSSKNEAECKAAVKEIYEAVNELASKGGIIAVDLHHGNWGIKPDTGKMAVLDLGVSPGGEKTPKIRLLAGAMGRRSRKKGR